MFGPPFGGMGGMGGFPGMAEFYDSYDDDDGMDEGLFGFPPNLMPHRQQAGRGMGLPPNIAMGMARGGGPQAGGFPMRDLEAQLGGQVRGGGGLPGMGPIGGAPPPGLEALLGGQMRGGGGGRPRGMGPMMGGVPMRGLGDPMGGGGGPAPGHIFDPSRMNRGAERRGQQPNAPRGRGNGPGLKYEKVKSLKTGGMSEEINLLRSKKDGKLYIEKRVRADGFMGQRTKAELATLKAVKGHSHLNKIIEHELQGKVCSIILDYCDLGSLADRMKEFVSKGGTLFHEPSLWNVLLGVSRALAFMHNGIMDVEREQPKNNWNTMCHLDLKPCNIFLSSTGGENGQKRVVLADFGCSVTLSDIENRKEHHMHQPCGTREWYPPEGLAGKGYGTKTDLFMLGATIHAVCLLQQVPHRPTLASSAPCGRKYSAELQRIVKELAHDRYDQRPAGRKVALRAAQVMRSGGKPR